VFCSRPLIVSDKQQKDDLALDTLAISAAGFLDDW